MTEQRIVYIDSDYSDIDRWIKENSIKNILFVHGKSADCLNLTKYLKKTAAGFGVDITDFCDFSPNPDYESALNGLELFNSNGCDAIVSIGGGSAIDVAKCIRVFYLNKVSGNIPFLAAPTTSGTGSESTRFAVIYNKGVKESIDDMRCLPDVVIMDSSSLISLPIYHRKATMLDALCHAVESWWSLASNDESIEYSKEAIRGITENMEGYLDNTEEGNTGMLRAANAAGRAISITRTTAGHAMCYKITSLFGCAHGHAAALCDRVLYEWMSRECRDNASIIEKLNGIANAMGCSDAEEGAEYFNKIFSLLEMDIPYASRNQIEVLSATVDPGRLINHPVSLNNETIRTLYEKILKVGE